MQRHLTKESKFYQGSNNSKERNGRVKMSKHQGSWEEDGQEVEIWWDFLEEAVADFKGFQREDACGCGEGTLIL